MSERPTYTLYLASDRDTGKFYDRPMSYVYRIVAPNGEVVHHAETGRENTIFKRMGDPDYLGLLDALPRVPPSVGLRVLTTRQHLYEREAYLGVLNERPEDRITSGYRKGAKRKGRYANEGQLREIDQLLISRQIVTSADRPALGDEDALHSVFMLRATEVIGIDPNAPEKEDY